MSPKSFLRIAGVTGLLTAVAAVSVMAQRGGGRGPDVPLPEGPGREQVQATCGACHSLGNITNSRGNSRQGWDGLTKSMTAMPDPLRGQVLEYLASHYPRKPGGEPVVVPGAVTASIKEWMLPTLGQRPHDPLASSDGMIWWTGQWANVLGRLDPKTGAMKEFPLKTPNSGPHGL